MDKTWGTGFWCNSAFHVLLLRLSVVLGQSDLLAASEGWRRDRGELSRTLLSVHQWGRLRSVSAGASCTLIIDFSIFSISYSFSLLYFVAGWSLNFFYYLVQFVLTKWNFENRTFVFICYIIIYWSIWQKKAEMNTLGLIYTSVPVAWKNNNLTRQFWLNFFEFSRNIHCKKSSVEYISICQLVSKKKNFTIISALMSSLYSLAEELEADS